MGFGDLLWGVLTVLDWFCFPFGVLEQKLLQQWSWQPLEI